MQELTAPAVKLREMIKAALDDEIITPEEREEIMMLAQEDGVVDAQEQALLQQLQDMIQNGTVKVTKA